VPFELGPTNPAQALRLLQLVVDTLPQFIFWKNRESVYLGCNENFAKVAGFNDPSELVGLTDFDLAWKEHESEYFRAIDKRVMDAGRPEYRILEPQKQSDGKEAWLETNKIPLFDDAGNVVGILGTFEDVTERKLAEEAAQHNKRLESIGKLAGGVAHDFNNLLGGIIGATEILQRRSPGQADQALLSEILRTAERASELTSKLLAFSRRGNVQSEVIDLHEAIANVAPLLKRGLDPRIQVEFRTDAKASFVAGDASELELAILNLSLNARDAMPDGGQLYISTTDVVLTSEQCIASQFNLKPGPHVRLQIQDTGTGIPEGIIDHIFEPFFTTKDVGSGTGLGLAAVYGAVQAHGGAIEVERGRPMGASFVIHLPLGETTPKRNEQAADDAKPIIEGVALVADDEPLLNRMTCERLKKLGFQTLAAENGEKALSLFTENRDDVRLVVLDVVMPRMGGLQCLAQIRALAPTLPVLIVSGFTRDHLVGRDHETQNAIFLKKPFGFSQLQAAVNQALTVAGGPPRPMRQGLPPE